MFSNETLGKLPNEPLHIIFRLSPLSYASFGGIVEIVELLLDNMGLKDAYTYNKNPLYLAVAHGRNEVVEFLLSKGVHPFLEHRAYRISVDLLRTAFARCSASAVDALVSTHGGDIHYSPEIVSSLERRRDPQLIKILFERIRFSRGVYVLICYSNNGNPELVYTNLLIDGRLGGMQKDNCVEEFNRALFKQVLDDNVGNEYNPSLCTLPRGVVMVLSNVY
ncbi:hypothetical protein BDD12DRAFT_889480 [Trichophaea hybrida]|nr:hypothetical protein BDD12DRAFT_889480 [Trichophaea hybrida]